MADNVLQAIQSGEATIVDLTRDQARSLIDEIDNCDKLIEALDDAQGDCLTEGPQYLILRISIPE